MERVHCTLYFLFFLIRVHTVVSVTDTYYNMKNTRSCKYAYVLRARAIEEKITIKKNEEKKIEIIVEKQKKKEIIKEEKVNNPSCVIGSFGRW